MKKTGVGLTLLILITFIFFGADDLFPLKYIIFIKIVCAVGGCIDVYMLADISAKNKKEELEAFFAKSNEQFGASIIKLVDSGKENTEKYSALLKEVSEKNTDMYGQTINKLDELFRQEEEDRNLYYERFDKKMSESVPGIVDAQNESARKAIAAIEKSDEKLDSTIMKLVDSEKENTEKLSVLLKDTSDINTDMYENCLNEMRKMKVIQEQLVSMEQELREASEKLFLNINNAMNGFVQVSGGVKDEVSALKMYTKVFGERIEEKVNDYCEKMEEGMEDGNEELQEILEESGKRQMDAYTAQTKALEECIGHIETVLNQTIGEVTSRNDSLLSNIERMQDEWTNLNKEEIEFLNRIWEEK